MGLRNKCLDIDKIQNHHPINKKNVKKYFKIRLFKNSYITPTNELNV